MTQRRSVLLAFGAAALAAPLAFAQRPRKMPLVGVLHPASPPPSPLPPAIVALQKGLRELGYVEGKSIAIEYRYGGGKPELLGGLARELVGLNVDVLVTVSSSALSAAKSVSGTTPIVATDLETDPIAGGIVASYARPGGNITGLFLDFGDLGSKLLQLLGELIPGTRRMVALWDTTTPEYHLNALAGAAKERSINLEVAKFKQVDEIDEVLQRALDKRPQALIQLSSALVYQLSARTAQFCEANRLPGVSSFDRFPEAGGLMSYGPNLPDFWRRIAPLVDKILKGARPSDLPLERPNRFELVLNPHAAKALGLKIPQGVLHRIDRLIQ